MVQALDYFGNKLSRFKTHSSDKGQSNSKCFFQAKDSSKNEQTNSTLLLLDLFSFMFWKKVKTPKRHFEIN